MDYRTKTLSIAYRLFKIDEDAKLDNVPVVQFLERNDFATQKVEFATIKRRKMWSLDKTIRIRSSDISLQTMPLWLPSTIEGPLVVCCARLLALESCRQQSRL